MYTYTQCHLHTCTANQFMSQKLTPVCNASFLQIQCSNLILKHTLMKTVLPTAWNGTGRSTQKGSRKMTKKYSNTTKVTTPKRLTDVWGVSHNPQIHGKNVHLCRQKENKGIKLSRPDLATCLSGARNDVSIGQLSKVVRLLAATPAWFCPYVTAAVDWA